MKMKNDDLHNVILELSSSVAIHENELDILKKENISLSAVIEMNISTLMLHQQLLSRLVQLLKFDDCAIEKLRTGSFEQKKSDQLLN